MQSCYKNFQNRRSSFFLFILAFFVACIYWTSSILPIRKRKTINDTHHVKSNFDKNDGDVFAFIHIQKTGGTTMEKHLIFNLKNSNCFCDRTHKQSCRCYEDSIKNEWLVCRYIKPGWPCGVHPDYATLKSCTPKFIHSRNHGNKQNYFYGTTLRDPVFRFLSEFRHVQRGGSWEKASSMCRGKLLAKINPSCFTDSGHLLLEQYMSCPYNLAVNRQTWMLSNISSVGCNFKEIKQSPQLYCKLFNIAKDNLKTLTYVGLLEYPKESQFVFEKTFNMKFIQPFQLWDTGFAYEYLKSFNISKPVLDRISKLNYLDVKLYNLAKKMLFDRYKYFVKLYGEPKYPSPKRKGMFSLHDVRRLRFQYNLPRHELNKKLLIMRRGNKRKNGTKV